MKQTDAECPNCGASRPKAIDQFNFEVGSVCPYCGHVEPAEGWDEYTILVALEKGLKCVWNEDLDSPTRPLPDTLKNGMIVYVIEQGAPDEYGDRWIVKPVAQDAFIAYDFELEVVTTVKPRPQKEL